MAKTLCLDLGNTNQKIGFFDNDNLLEKKIIDACTIENLRPHVESFHPEKIILSSVIKHDTSVHDYLSSVSKFHFIHHETIVPFTTPVPAPKTIGADRIALLTAAEKMFPKKNILIICSGTCITYNFLSNQAVFLGGSISPGMQMRFNALKDYTAALPLVKPEITIPLIGYDTKTNITSGVELGLVYEIDGFIDAYNSRYKNLEIILTGGDMRFIQSHLQSKITFDEDLLMKGLNYLAETNCG